MQSPEKYRKDARRTGVWWAAGLVTETLASVKFAVLLVILLTAACIVGTIVPQGMDAFKAAEKSPTVAQWLPTLQALGLTETFYSTWFTTLLGLLAASIAMCSRRRFRTLIRSSGAVRVRALGSMLTHISFLLILAGGVVRGVWGIKGTLELHEGEAKNSFARADGPVQLPFAVHLEKFQLIRDEAAKLDQRGASAERHDIQIQWPEKSLAARVTSKIGEWQTLVTPAEAESASTTVRFRLARFVPDFVIDNDKRQIISRSDRPNNPAVLVEVKGPGFENNQWLFARHPDFSLQNDHGNGSDPHLMPLKMTYLYTPQDNQNGEMALKNFRSTVRLVENGTAGASVNIEVNSPLKYKGYTFFQSGYNPDDLCWTALEVVRDPGVPLVYSGFFFLIGGLFISFYLNPWLETRKTNV